MNELSMTRVSVFVRNPCMYTKNRSKDVDRMHVYLGALWCCVYCVVCNFQDFYQGYLFHTVVNESKRSAFEKRERQKIQFIVMVSVVHYGLVT